MTQQNIENGHKVLLAQLRIRQEQIHDQQELHLEEKEEEGWDEVLCTVRIRCSETDKTVLGHNSRLYQCVQEEE
jgi:hypothetical protein